MNLTDLFFDRVRENNRYARAEQNAAQSYEDSVENAKAKLLSDPVAIEKAVANISDYLSPSASTKKPKGESYGLDTVEGSKSSNDPTVGFGVTLRDEYTKALANPAARGISAGQLLQNVSNSMMNTPREDGMSLRDKAYRYTRTESDRLWGGDKVKPIPGYEAWRKDKAIQERDDVDKESWLATPRDIVTSAGFGATIGAITGATGGGLAGAGATAGVMGLAGLAMGGPVGGVLGAGLGVLAGAAGSSVAGAGLGAALGAAGGVVGEVVGAPLRKLLHKTDWYHGQIESNKTIDKANAILADVATAAVPGFAMERGIIKGGIATKNYFKEGLNIAQDDRVGLTGAPFSRWYKGRPDPNVDLFARTGMEPGVDLSGAGGPAGVKRTAESPQSPLRFLGYDETAGATEGLVIGPKRLNWTRGPYPGEGGGGGGGAPEDPNSFLQNTLKFHDDNGFTNTLKEAIKVYNRPSDMDRLLGKEPPKMIGLDSSFGMKTRYTGDELAGIWKNIDGVMVGENGAPNPYLEKQKAVGKSWYQGKAEAEVTSLIAEQEKTVNKVLANPTAKNIVDNPVPKITDIPTGIKESEVPTGAVVPKDNPDIMKVQNLSSDADAELGLTVKEGVEPIQEGTFSEKLNIAASNDDAVKILHGDPEARGKLEATATAQFNKKLNADNSKIVSEVVDTYTPDVEAVVETGKKTKTVKMKATTEKKKVAKDVVKTMTYEVDPELKHKFYDEIIESTEDEWLKRIAAQAKDPDTVKQMKKDTNTDFRAFAKEQGVELPKGFKLIAGMMAFGFTADALHNMISDFVPGESNSTGVANAGMLNNPAVKGILQAAEKSNFFAKAVSKGQTIMNPENFQMGVVNKIGDTIKGFTNNIRKNTGSGIQYAIMSPYQAVESISKTGAGKAINPAPFLASFEAAGATNVKNSTKVLKNILDKGGIKVASNQVAELYEPIIPLAAKATKVGVLENKLRIAENRLDFLTGKTKIVDLKAHDKDLEKLANDIVSYKDELNTLNSEGVTKKFTASWESITRKAAAEHSSVRVSLAVEDPAGTLYPWLKLSRKEEVAAGEVRAMLEQYRVRLKERKLRTRDDYFPHSIHPASKEIYQKEMENVVGGVPYSKFYSRTENSRPLIPDVHYTMNSYLNDIEQRIQYHDMWKVSGWKKVMNSDVVQANPGLKRAFTQLHEGSKPRDEGWVDTTARRYAEFEAYKRLFLNPSAGLKHLVKLSADIVTLGPKVFAEAAPEAAGYMVRKVYNMTPNSVKGVLSNFGIKSERFGRQLIDDYVDSIIQSGHMRRYMFDMGMDSTDEMLANTKGLIKNTWGKVQDVGSFWINTAEILDRGMSVLSALKMSAKKGMTADQAMYGTYDTILKNNFLFGKFNPSWLNDPIIRAGLMFQATPYKIFERRLVNAQKSYSAVKGLSTEVQKLWKTKEGRDKVMTDLIGLKSLVKKGENRLKANLVIDSLKQETDYFGTPVIQQLVWDVLTVGGMTYGGAQAGLHLKDHFFHIPFLSTMSEEGKAELAISPIFKSTMEGYNAWKTKDDSDFLVLEIGKRWLGETGPLPDTLKKVAAFSDGDIPAVYKKGGGSEYLKYLFSIPGEGE